MRGGGWGVSDVKELNECFCLVDMDKFKCAHTHMHAHKNIHTQNGSSLWFWESIVQSFLKTPDGFLEE